jgi:hypothetical protein
VCFEAESESGSTLSLKVGFQVQTLPILPILQLNHYNLLGISMCQNFLLAIGYFFAGGLDAGLHAFSLLKKLFHVELQSLYAENFHSCVC